MLKKIVFILALAGFSFSCSTNNDVFKIQAGEISIFLNDHGLISKVTDNKNNNLLLGTDNVSLLSFRVNGDIIYPDKLWMNEGENIISLMFDSITAHVSFINQQDYVKFSLDSISHNDNIEMVLWGPIPLSVNDNIGETVGVVSNSDIAIGIQSLNPKTLGGYPWKENDCMPQIDIFEGDDFTDLSEKGKRYVLYRVEAAKPIENGSSLQCYCRNRDKERIVENWGQKNYISPIYEDGGIIGSSIALFSCKPDSVLSVISKIEINEKLPHPMIDGLWGKKSPLATSAYLILDFGEENIDKAISITKQAGLKYLYHSGPFSNWGHFELKKAQFPNGYEGLKSCVAKAEENGIHIGVHTLSNFITTNDPYVTPVPDSRLGLVGNTVLIENISVDETEIQVENPLFFNDFNNNNLRTIMIGEELIRYGSVSETIPYVLQDCQRGAFDTKKSDHKAGEKVSKLADHGYKVFLTNPELGLELANNIADLFNQTGLRQISFDGVEGNRSTGMGNYGEILFTTEWYNNLDDNIKQHLIADASRTSHYFWHIYSRMNWGEPWYAGFRESQTEYRLKNQPYFKRNYMPAMLGWFQMKAETSLEDIEWLLARSAGFDAGYAFVTNYNSIEKNGFSDEIFKQIGRWEDARINDRFTEEQKLLMQDVSNEYSLINIDGKEYLLPYEIFRTELSNLEKQPGEPTYNNLEINNPGEEQYINFIFTAIEADISNITLEVDNYKSIEFPFILKKSQIAKYNGEDEIYIYNNNWQLKKKHKIDKELLKVKAGGHQLKIDCNFSGNEESKLKTEFRLNAAPQLLINH
ncbi:hypothetical protein ACFLRY_01370 [Bacteroidota bacterium]